MLDHFESGDLLAMAAPTPICPINGEQDCIFPIVAARTEFARAAAVYAAIGADSRIAHAIHPDDHRYRFDLARDFIHAHCPP